MQSAQVIIARKMLNNSGRISIQKFHKKNNSMFQTSSIGSPKKSIISSGERISTILESKGNITSMIASSSVWGEESTQMNKLTINFSSKQNKKSDSKFRRNPLKVHHAKFIPCINFTKAASKAIPLNSRILLSKPSHDRSRSLGQYSNFETPARLKKNLIHSKKVLNGAVRIRLSSKSSPYKRVRPKSRINSTGRPLSKMQYSKFKRIDSALRVMHQSLYEFKGTINNWIKNANQSFRRNYLSWDGEKKTKKKHKPFEPFPIEDYLDKSLENFWEE